MPSRMISRRRHCAFELSIRTCVIKIVSTISYKPLVSEFHQTYNLDAFVDKKSNFKVIAKSETYRLTVDRRRLF